MGQYDVPTVTVVGQNGEPLVINEADFDPAVHKRWQHDVERPEDGNVLFDAGKPDTEAEPASGRRGRKA